MSKKAVEIIKSKMSKKEIAQLVENAKLREVDGRLYSFATITGGEEVRTIYRLFDCFFWIRTKQHNSYWARIFKRFTHLETNTPIDITEFR